MRISEALLPEFDQEMATTRKILLRVPEDKLNYKPHAKSFDMGSLAIHIAQIVGWGAETIAKPDFDVAPVGAPPYQPPTIKNNQELIAMLDKNIATFRTAIEGATDEQFMQPWSLLAGGKPIFTMPRVAVIRGMVINHLIHHRGALSVYLRLNDVPLPAMYGPSADEKE
jgi:uncharacterized damage-inducible protein DinB